MPTRSLQEAVIVDSIRTPIGTYGGALSSVRPDDLAALIIRTLVERCKKIDPEQIEDVIFGDSNQAGEDSGNVSRTALLMAGLPIKVAGSTVNRLGGSGLEAVIQAAQSVMLGNGSVFIAGGVESMSRSPFIIPKSTKAFSNQVQIYDTTTGWRFVNPKLREKFDPLSSGETAENLAERYSISREEQDKYALKSHQQATKAIDAGTFADEIVPVPTVDESGNQVVVSRDESPKSDISLEKLKSMKPAFREGGSVSVGNSSGMGDGAAGLVVMNAKKAKRLELTPKARVVASAVAGVHPSFMGLGPVPATRKVLKRAGLELEDVDLIEVDESSAVQVLSCLKFMDYDSGRMNVNGGAIALGSPVGCSGARILTTLLHEMERRKCRYGLTTICIGAGQGIALLVERV